ncbi:protein Njmu-R1 isoform X4 [Corvus cornix cornix]|uniref:protein Njmu-R1 isoform X4 n=2 Tax=Corvus TaxID=30420 RepID=UPI00053553B2|nr:protein Njmu-R1 isoform X4 [Corvus cornix cornix]XP_041888249.1 protein Njmu-R1 isoform X4 [Corvus kubaryi]
MTSYCSRWGEDTARTLRKLLPAPGPGAGSRHTRRAGWQRSPVAPRCTGGAGAAMLPVLPDGDERELESSEEGGGTGEERRPERHGCTYHGLYGYRSIPEGKVGCYYCRFQQESLLEMATLESDINAPEYVVCFLGGSEKGLELFRLELDKYIQNLKINLDLEQKSLETCVSPYLRSWFEDAICPIQRVMQLFQDKLASLLHAALSYTPVEVKNADERTEKDISRFLAAASLQGLVQEGTMTSLCIAMTEEQHKSMVIDCSGPQPQLHNAGSNRFCEDWMQAFVNGAEGANPFLFRQILENFKLKAIQDINNLKRFIRQAEMNHYALFKCYLFLKNCGSGDILLKIVKVEHAEMPEARNVVTVLEEFMRETSVA